MSQSFSGGGRSAAQAHLEWDGSGCVALVEESVREAMEEWGPRMVDFAKELAPVDTGALQDSIEFEVKDASGGEGVELVLSADTSDVHPQGLNYAFFQEVGTVQNAAQPYLMPAMQAHVDVIMRTAQNNYRQRSSFFGRLKSAAKRFFRF